MIVEAANEGAQSLPSRVSNAQRIHEKSVSNGDILAVLDSSSEDDGDAPKAGGAASAHSAAAPAAAPESN